MIDARIKLGHELVHDLNPAFDPGLILGGSSVNQIENRARRWSSFNSELLRSLFDTEEVAADYEFFVGIGVGSTYDGPAVILRRRRESVEDDVSRLQGIVEKIRAGLYGLADDSPGGSHLGSAQLSDKSKAAPSSVINIYGGNVGMLNAGEVLGSIHSRVSTVTGSSSADAFRQAVEEFSKIIANDKDLSEENRTEALETVDHIAEAAGQPVERRRIAVLRRVLAAIPETLALSSRALEAWDKYSGPIRAHLKL